MKQRRLTKRKHDHSATRVGGTKACPPYWVLDCAEVELISAKIDSLKDLTVVNTNSVTPW